jgi:hypothetical protein
VKLPPWNSQLLPAVANAALVLRSPAVFAWLRKRLYGTSNSCAVSTRLERLVRPSRTKSISTEPRVEIAAIVMTDDHHTYGAKCRLAPVSRIEREDEVPPVQAQFFYSSVIPIDDPLSTSSTAGAETRTGKGQVRPFARGDNNALEKAWLGLMSESARHAHRDALESQGRAAEFDSDRLTSIIQAVTAKHWDRHRKGYQPQDVAAPTGDILPTTPVAACCSELVLDVSEELEQAFCALVRRRNAALNVDEVVQQVVLALERLKKQANDESETQPLPGSPPFSRPGTASTTNTNHPLARMPKTTTESNSSKRRSTISEARTRTNSLSMSQPASQPLRSPTPFGSLGGLARPPVLDDGISGKPFVRVGSPETQSEPGSLPLPGISGPARDNTRTQEQSQATGGQQTTTQTTDSKMTKAVEPAPLDIAEVAVGLSRLHMVSLPMLQMKPIYWSPINDVAVVSRATWFYR